MKLSDYVAQFLVSQGVRHTFAVIGGASVHLIDSIAKTLGIEYICPQHEQAGAMAADAYSRATGNLGVAIATSGPGATNLITGIACSYFDSVPVLYLTGQVTTFRLKGDTGVRQMGFQETEIVDMVRPITKYAVMVRDPRKIRYELEKAVHIAKSARSGPVLVDIPDDLQRMNIDVSNLEQFVPETVEKPLVTCDTDVSKVVELMRQSTRPVLIIGWGVRLAKAESEALYLVNQLGIPVLLTWPMLDMIPSNHPLAAGPFGTHGARYANYALQNSDLIISIGARLDTREAGSPYSEFGRGARKIIVDIDPAELNKFSKFGMSGIDLLINTGAGEFIRSLSRAWSQVGKVLDISSWLKKISDWTIRYPICPSSYYKEQDLNPYVFVKQLSDFSQNGDLFVLDTGCALAYMCQAFQFKKDQRLFHAFNTTPMGYGLPAAIGVSFARDRGLVTCIAGDGGFQMNIQEMATVIRHNLPIRIFLINNKGYSMVRQTQEQWLGGRYEAVSVESGLAFPDFVKVAKAYGFITFSLSRNDDVKECLRLIYKTDGPVFCDVEINPEHRVIPQVRFGRPLEDGEPFLERQEFFENMIVDPTESSKRPL